MKSKFWKFILSLYGIGIIIPIIFYAIYFSLVLKCLIKIPGDTSFTICAIIFPLAISMFIFEYKYYKLNMKEVIRKSKINVFCFIKNILFFILILEMFYFAFANEPIWSESILAKHKMIAVCGLIFFIFCMIFLRIPKKKKDKEKSKLEITTDLENEILEIIKKSNNELLTDISYYIDNHKTKEKQDTNKN